MHIFDGTATSYRGFVDCRIMRNLNSVFSQCFNHDTAGLGSSGVTNGGVSFCAVNTDNDVPMIIRGHASVDTNSPTLLHAFAEVNYIP